MYAGLSELAFTTKLLRSLRTRSSGRRSGEGIVILKLLWFAFEPDLVETLWNPISSNASTPGQPLTPSWLKDDKRPI